MMDNEACEKCTERQIKESGYINYKNCEYCRIGIAQHAEEDGTPWDLLDKLSARYRGTDLNGDWFP